MKPKARSKSLNGQKVRNLSERSWKTRSKRLRSDAARTALQDTIAAIIRDPPLNAWHSIPFEGVYHSDDTTQNACKTLAILTYSKGSLTQGGISVHRWSIHYTGVSSGCLPRHCPSVLVLSLKGLL